MAVAKRSLAVALLVVAAAALSAVVSAEPAVRRPSAAAPPAVSAAAAARLAASAAAQQAARLAGVLDASACPPFVGFFPPGSEEFNVPTAWGKSHQMQAGNPFPDRLLPVVLSAVTTIPGSAVATPPTLQLAVSHPLLGQPGALLPLDCMGAPGGGGSAPAAPRASPLPTGAITRRRSLLQQAGNGGLYLSKPATYSVTWSLNGTAPSTRTFAPGASGERPRIMLPELSAMPDAFYCLTITVAVQPWTGLVGQTRAAPVSPLFVTKQVCFVKADRAITADVSFDGCGAPFAMLLSNVSLPAVPLVPGVPNAGVLGITALRVRATLNRTEDGAQVPEGARRELTKWFLLDRPLPAGYVLRSRPDEAPVAGWYNVEIDSSFVTNRPGLVALPASGSFGRYDPNVPAPLRGQLRFAAGVWSTDATGELVPLQAEPSAAFGEISGPEEYSAQANGAQVQFAWRTTGLGPTYCYVDGEQQVNDDRRRCRSPLDTHLKDAARNSTLSLAFTDACGDLHGQQLEFGKFGFRPTRQIRPPARRGRAGIDVDDNGSPAVGSAAAAAAMVGAEARSGPDGGWGGAGGAEYDAGNATITAGTLRATGGAGGAGGGGALLQARHKRAAANGAGASMGGGGGATGAAAAVLLASAVLAMVV